LTTQAGTVSIQVRSSPLLPLDVAHLTLITSRCHTPGFTHALVTSPE
jgi:hypothetical protein